MRFFTCILLCFFSVFACTAQKKVTEVLSHELDSKHILLVLDSATASNVLLQDRTDGFFDLVTASEMSIQMKQPLEEGKSRADLMPDFLNFLRRDVDDFSLRESVGVAEVMQEVFDSCKTLAPNIFPDTLILIKTKARHYGESVYYTRENCIVVPYDVLGAKKRKAFTTTMYHELFHVYSRKNPDKRAQLYRLIGFEAIGLRNLRIPKPLAARILYNPDGVDFAQKITLKTSDGKMIDAIPVLFANNTGFKTGQDAFFGYVEFNLYQIEKNREGSWVVLTQEDQLTSTLNLKEVPDFFRQIKDNTGYIIHPDEVLADNFSFLMEARSNPEYVAKFSAEGKQLLTDMKKIITAKK